MDLGLFVFITVIAVILITAACKNRLSADQHAAIEAIQKFMTSIEQMKRGYIDHRQYESTLDRWKRVSDILRTLPSKAYKEATVQEFLSTYDNLQDLVDQWNKSFIEEEVRNKTPLLAKATGKTLDEQQMHAVVTDEINQLVIAGAGSGKTLTIIAKVYYLVHVKGIAPANILLLAFNRSAAAEITERINTLGIQMEAMTFHKLGYHTIMESTHKRPDIDNTNELRKAIMEYFISIIPKDKKRASETLRFLGLYSIPMSSEDQFEHLGNYFENARGLDFETLRSKYERSLSAEQKSLKGEQMRSIEETIIANYLFLHGVQYVYEKRYPHEGDDYRRSYHPDFYLPDYDIYIEHFGIDNKGELPWLTKIEAQKYKLEMRWKRDMHAKHKTKLLETYSYWKSEGKLSEKLDALLRANGVQYKSVNEAEIVRCIMRNENDYGLAEIVKLIESFLRLYKENTAISFAQLRETVKGYADPYERKRAELFLSIAEPIYNLYESRLRDKELIDFSDMIIEAADIIRNGYVLHDLDYIIVDEFQDISQSRYSLITALRDRTNAKIFCAGDDWQSIYRFTGCELDFLTRFEKHFGYSKLLRVEHTYRYSQELISAIEPFILKNPAQIRKSMRSSNHEANPVRLYRYTQSKEGVLSSAVEDIVKTYGQKKSILLLMRNNFDLNFLNESENWYVQTDKQERIRTCIYRIYPDLRITAMTVHSSKGVEADNVIIVNGDNALVGFPNKMADDPLIQLLRIGDEKYTYAEERRLFYVAVTRTKYRTYILTPESAPSEFILELSEMPNVSVYKETEKTGEQLYVCPHCLRGHLVHRKSLENGQEFVGCSLYPQCRNTYNDTSLLKHAIKCPRCQGYMVNRNGVNGIFIGCSNYPLCKNTMSAYSEYPQAKVGIKATR